MTDSFDIGDNKRFSITFTDIVGAAADPTAITAVITEPDGVVTTYVYGTDAELVKDSVGVYYVDWTFAKKGRHKIKISGTGAVVSAEQVEIWVRS